MGFVNLFIAALMPVLKVILMAGVGLFIALDRIKLLGPQPNGHLNNIVYYVFTPALTATSLAETVTLEGFITLWFMPLNLLLSFVFGSVLAWFLIKITKTPKHIQGIVIACCSAGNTGNLFLIMIPGVCQESNNPFGDAAICSMHARPYAALSLAIGSVYMWSYVYGMVQLYANSSISETLARSSTELTALPSTNGHNFDGTIPQMSASKKILQRMKIISEKVDLKKVFAPTAIAAVVGFIIGIVSPIRKLLIGNKAPLRVIDSSAYILGEAAIPCVTLIMGANLLRGLKGSDVSRTVIIGIIGVRNMLLPLIGIGVVKAALHLGLVASDNKLYQFVLMLQFAVPPAMAVGTMTQYFELGQCESSVIMLWSYVVAAFSFTLWSTLFMWILA